MCARRRSVVTSRVMTRRRTRKNPKEPENWHVECRYISTGACSRVLSRANLADPKEPESTRKLACRMPVHFYRSVLSRANLAGVLLVASSFVICTVILLLLFVHRVGLYAYVQYVIKKSLLLNCISCPVPLSGYRTG